MKIHQIQTVVILKSVITKIDPNNKTIVLNMITIRFCLVLSMALFLLCVQFTLAQEPYKQVCRPSVFSVQRDYQSVHSSNYYKTNTSIIVTDIAHFNMHRKMYRNDEIFAVRNGSVIPLRTVFEFYSPQDNMTYVYMNTTLNECSCSKYQSDFLSRPFCLNVSPRMKIEQSNMGPIPVTIYTSMTLRSGYIEKASYVTMPTGLHSGDVGNEDKISWMVNVDLFMSTEQSKVSSSERYTKHALKFDENLVFDQMMNYVMQSNACPRKSECDGPH
ncbi:hypothetical protein C9374_006494 [Naegleria lovaniensis]|uniref:Uncharacterized protein n=1 Tax=Naegleria lovaniensis TaxID=51637 RepID=A0AA88GJX0_NAELO|nr:uncharacterized protein C9374_006494 [Naegleria lovaniensis]KAG2381505.1 hypothetical protein C9374_006494 [Naegleria lovaniensis]